MISIIDYGIGNVNAFGNIYHSIDIPFNIAKSADDLKNSQKLILPGVGCFDHAITEFNKSEMKAKVEELVLSQNIPILGVCIGMHMLADSSDEGQLPGLGWISGKVRRFSTSNHPLPHMGWNNILVKKEDPLLKDLNESSTFYFLHSYYFDELDTEHVLATSHYESSFASIVKLNNIYGVQPHPEKSHSYGLTLLKNFGELNAET
jgi:glutamine amidotransferase